MCKLTDWLKRTFSSENVLKKYGLSFDDSVELDVLPIAYPKVNSQYKLQEGERVFAVHSINEIDTTVIILDISRNKVHEIDIELFDELFTPVNAQTNLPIVPEKEE